VSILRDVYAMGDLPEGYKPKSHVIRTIYCIWVIPDVNSYSWFKEDFEKIIKKYQESVPGLFPVLNLWVYVTRHKNNDVISQEFLIGHPDFDQILEVAQRDNRKKAIQVFACGPSLLVNQAWDSSNLHSNIGHRIDFAHETFEW